MTLPFDVVGLRALDARQDPGVALHQRLSRTGIPLCGIASTSPGIPLPGLVALLGLVLSARAGSGPGQADGGATSAGQAGAATQTSEGGQVTVKVTWARATEAPAFTVTMDTHAVDLDGDDLGQLVVLRSDQGQEVRPAGWAAPKGGHHREGRLTFPATAADGSPLIGPGTRAIELTIRDVAGVPERSSRWAL